MVLAHFVHQITNRFSPSNCSHCLTKQHWPWMSFQMHTSSLLLLFLFFSLWLALPWRSHKLSPEDVMDQILSRMMFLIGTDSIKNWPSPNGLFIGLSDEWVMRQGGLHFPAPPTPAFLFVIVMNCASQFASLCFSKNHISPLSYFRLWEPSAALRMLRGPTPADLHPVEPACLHLPQSLAYSSCSPNVNRIREGRMPPQSLPLQERGFNILESHMWYDFFGDKCNTKMCVVYDVRLRNILNYIFPRLTSPAPGEHWPELMQTHLQSWKALEAPSPAFGSAMDRQVVPCHVTVQWASSGNGRWGLKGRLAETERREPRMPSAGVWIIVQKSEKLPWVLTMAVLLTDSTPIVIKQHS